MKCLLAIVLSCTLCGIMARTINPVSLDMNCYKKDYSTAIACTFVFTNDGPNDLYLLKRNTPLEGLLSPFITVYSQTGHPLQYKGFLLYRTHPTKDEIVLLKASKSISATVDITKAFTFQMDGLYDIRYDRPLEMSDGVSSFQIPLLESVSMYVENTHLISQLTYMEESQLEMEVEEQGSEIVTVNMGCRLRFIGGTSGQRQNFQKAHNRMCNKLPNVARRLEYNSLYKLWFGAYSATRFNTVKRILQNSANGLQNDVVTYNMNGPGCKPNIVAYTYHGSRSVFACPYMHRIQVYCTNSNNIPDTQEGILFHEWSHAYGYTNDHAYGASLDRHLAQYTPNKAVNNADNYERYYCPASFAV